MEITSSVGPVKAVSISGLLQNMLHAGFDLESCFGELIDNSFGEGATKVNIYITTYDDEYCIIFSDNGNGMTKRLLEEAHQLHKRKEASDSKQGRFGIGGKEALVVFSEIKSDPITISRHESNEFSYLIFEIVDAVRTDDLCPKAYPVTYRNAPANIKPKWDKFSVDKDGKGTVVYIPIEKDMYNTITKNLQSLPLESNILFYLNLTYNYDVNNGKSINIYHNNNEYSISGIDPLSFENIQNNHKSDTEVKVYQHSNTKEVRCTFINGLGKNVMLDYSKKEPKQVNSLTDGFDHIGSLNIKIAYSEDKWVNDPNADKKNKSVSTQENDGDEEEIDDEFEGKVHNLLGPQVYIVEKYGSNVTATRSYMNGSYYARNHKIVKHFQKHDAKTGNFDERPVKSYTRVYVNFPSSLDTLMGLQVNKSDMKEANIHVAIRKAIENLEKNFKTKLNKEYKSITTSSIVSSSSVSTPEISPVPSTPSSPQPSNLPQVSHVIPEITPISGLEGGQNGQSADNEEEMVDVEDGESHKSVSVSSNNAVAEAPGMIHVPAYERPVTVGDKYLVEQFLKLRDQYNSITLKTLVEKASNNVRPGNTEVLRSLNHIEKFLQEVMGQYLV